MSAMWTDLTHLDISVLDKIIRTVVVYWALIVLLRLAGKRDLAQLNSFDLIVMLLLSNVVQNAIIGADNSLAGGLLGALTLVAVDYLFDRFAFMIKGSERFLDGRPVLLVEDGRVHSERLRRVGIRDTELRTVLHRLGADNPTEVDYAMLRPGGGFDMTLKRHEQNASAGELEAAVHRIEQRIDERFAALEARLPQARE
jgi:uncharacterized membrane protein YcaP (DUF421 family)